MVDISQLSPADELLRAAKAALADDRDFNHSYHSTAKAMDDLEAAILRVEREPGAGGWIVWRGGHCPVDFDAVVDISRPDGVRTRQTAGHYVWHHHDTPGDITAYRPSPALPQIGDAS